MMKRVLFLLLSLLSIGAWADDVTAVVDNIGSYSGTASYVFNKADSKVYARNNLGSYERYGVYEKVSLTHNEVEYIATDASHLTYINTGYIHKANTRIVADVEMTEEGDGWQAVFGARENSFRSHAFVLFSTANHNDNHNGVFNRSGAENDFDNNLPANTRMIIDASGQTATVKNWSNGSTIATATTTGTADDGTNAMFIFNTNTAGSGGVNPDGSDNKMKLYSFRIYEGTTLVKDYVPVVTSSGKGGLKDKLTGDILTSAKADVDFVHASYVPVTTYNGKIVYNKDDGYAYQYNGTSFVKKNAVTLTSIDNSDYKNLKNWRCPDVGQDGDHWASVFGTGDKIAYDSEAGTNSINPYVGQNNWEPIHYTVTVDANSDYNVSFKYSTGSWETWNKNHNETPDPLSLPFKIIDREDYTQNNGKFTDAGLIAYAGLSYGMTDKQDISVDFTSTTSTARFIIQFGVVDDGEKGYWFGFDNWEVKKYNFTDSYPDLEVAIKSVAWAKEKGIDTSDVEALLAQTMRENIGSPRDVVVIGLKQSLAEKSPQPTVFTMVSESVVGTDDNNRGVVVDDHDKGFYVYNVGTGRWFCGGDDWGAHAAVGFPGIKVTTPENNYESGHYNSIKTWLFNGDWNNGGLLNNGGYCDTDGNGWKFFKQNAGQGIYTWARNGDNTGNNSGNGYGTKNLVGFASSTYARVNTDCSGADNPYNQWIFVTEEQRDAAMGSASVSNPIDVTYKIKMPGFNQRERKEGTDQNSEVLDWTCNHANYRYDAANNESRLLIMGRNDNHADFVCDVYGGQWNDEFSLTQTITGLMPGKYRVKVQGYNNMETENAAYLEANGVTQRLVNINSEDVLPWTTRLPGETFEAPEYFQVGLYWNEVECTVGGDGNLTLGVKSPSVTGAHVFIFDNFRLLYLGPTDVEKTLHQGYATFSATCQYAIEGTEVKAYKAVEKDAESVRLQELDGEIPANTGVVLYGDGASSVTLKPANGTAATNLGDNLMKPHTTAGVVAETEVVGGETYTNYLMSKSSDGTSVVFRPSSGNGSLAAGTAYMQLRGDATAKRIVFGDETGIVSEELNVKGEKLAPAYNLQGQRVSEGYKGITIVKGKKVKK